MLSHESLIELREVTRHYREGERRGEVYELAMDITKFLMEGMAVSQIVSQKEMRVKRMIDYLGDRLEEIFHSADNDGAIHRHSSKG